MNKKQFEKGTKVYATKRLLNSIKSYLAVVGPELVAAELDTLGILMARLMVNLEGKK